MNQQQKTLHISINFCVGGLPDKFIFPPYQPTITSTLHDAQIELYDISEEMNM
jgi:hypothetical protein